MSMVQIPSSVHCMPLPDRPGALKRISTFPGRLGQPRFGVAGVSPCCAHDRFDANTPPTVAAVLRNVLRLIVVISGTSLEWEGKPPCSTCQPFFGRHFGAEARAAV